ncbi:MAG: hypothetical protein WB660_27470, partial [Candidatus Sulfotelmatobacter sp.]
IRTLSSTSEYLPGRARSVLAANISNGLQAYSYSIMRGPHRPWAQFMAVAQGQANLCSHKV